MIYMFRAPSYGKKIYFYDGKTLQKLIDQYWNCGIGSLYKIDNTNGGEASRINQKERLALGFMKYPVDIIVGEKPRDYRKRKGLK